MSDYIQLLNKILDQIKHAADLKHDYEKMRNFADWCEREIETASRSLPQKPVEPVSPVVSKEDKDFEDIVWGLDEHSLLEEEEVQPKENKSHIKVNEPELITIQAGAFKMGDFEEKDAGPVHDVTIPEPFKLGKYPVTYREFKIYFDYLQEEERKRHRIYEEKEHLHYNWGGEVPVVEVSWEDANGYIDWLNKQTGRHYRLPTEAEWEYACRAGTFTNYSFGESDRDLEIFAWYLDNSGGRAQPVGKKEPNEWGLYDMHGNVWEWTQDCYAADYSHAPNDGSAYSRPDCVQRVVRGGSWDLWAEELKSGHRDKWAQDARYNDVGFRLAHDL